MGWMIMVVKEEDIGDGCKSCRFRFWNKCYADKRVDIFDSASEDEINEYRPYSCPFRHYGSKVSKITDRFHGMTKQETYGWFNGANSEHQRYIRLEEERNRYVQYNYRENLINAMKQEQGDAEKDV